MSAAEKLDVTREIHTDPGVGLPRIRYVIELMIQGRFERGETASELAADWGLSLNAAQYYTKQAAHQLELLGERDHVLNLVRMNASKWIHEAGPDRVPASKLLLETVGGIVQRHEVKLDVHQRSERELFLLCLSEIRSDPKLRAEAIAFLQAEGDAVGLLTEGEAVET